MKKILASIAFACLALPASAQHWHHQHHHHHRGGGNWVGPLIGGMMLGAVLANSRPAQADPVVVMPSVSPLAPSVIINPATNTYYNCLVRVYDPLTGLYRNEVMTCVR